MEIKARRAPICEEGEMWLRSAIGAMALSVATVAAQSAQAQSLLDIHKGAGVACSACHVEEPFAAPPDAVCVACHGTMLENEDGDAGVRPDPHRALQLGEGEVPPCTTCHAVHGATE